jgi:hypothetical protein
MPAAIWVNLGDEMIVVAERTSFEEQRGAERAA